MRQTKKWGTITSIMGWIGAASLLFTLTSWGYQVHLVEDQGQPQVEEAMRSLLVSHPFEVRGDTEEVVSRFWPRKQIPIKRMQEGQADILLPMLKPGTFLGVAEYLVDAEGCYEQRIPRGLYTVRYMRLPQDGNHIGVYPTRDFLFLLPVSVDPNPVPRSPDGLLEVGREVDLHPYTLPLVEFPSDEAPKGPTMGADEAERPALFFPWRFQVEGAEKIQERVLGFVIGLGMPEGLTEY